MAKLSILVLLLFSLLLMISISECRTLSIGEIETGKSQVECEKVYSAQAGDICNSVAQKFQLASESFLAINPNINCDSFFVGQWLCIEGQVN